MKKIWNKSNISWNIFLSITKHSGFILKSHRCLFFWDKLNNLSFLLHFLQGSRLESQIPVVLNVCNLLDQWFLVRFLESPSQSPFFYEVCAQSSSLCSHQFLEVVQDPQSVVDLPVCYCPCTDLSISWLSQIIISYRFSRISGPWSIPVPWRLSQQSCYAMSQHVLLISSACSFPVIISVSAPIDT